jgi:hypothetical protein
LNTKSNYSSDIKADLVQKDIQKLSYFNPSDAHDTNIKGKYANLAFHSDTIVMKNANDIDQLSKVRFTEKPYLLELNMKNYHPTFHSVHMMLYSIL